MSSARYVRCIDDGDGICDGDVLAALTARLDWLGFGSNSRGSKARFLNSADQSAVAALVGSTKLAHNIPVRL
jgi:hypothetical protein